MNIIGEKVDAPVQGVYFFLILLSLHVWNEVL